MEFNFDLNWLELQSALVVLLVLCVGAAVSVWRAR